jgi:hypothetical protein
MKEDRESLTSVLTELHLDEYKTAQGLADLDNTPHSSGALLMLMVTLSSV